MPFTFNHWRSGLKICLFSGICGLFALSNAIIFIAPVYKKIRYLHTQTTSLNQQWGERRLVAVRRQQLQQDIILLRYPYLVSLQALHQKLTLAELYRKISLLAKTHELQILSLTPQTHQFAANLDQQIFSIEISGAESKILSFLQLMMHQSWLIEIQQLELTTTTAGIHLQITLAAYYDSK